MRQGAPNGKDVEYTEDRLIEVPQISIYQMTHPKYPEYPIYYRHCIVRSSFDGHIHRLTQDSILHFTWLESVNEHPNETMALQILERTMPQWGFECRSLPIAQDTNFPDGQALIDGELSNLEVVSIQPRYPGGHSLHDLVSLTQVGRTNRPEDKAVLKCQDCRTTQALEHITLENLPTHEENHRWVVYLPGSLFAPDWPLTLAATPLLTIRQEDFEKELATAVKKKSEIIAAQGEGLRNWVVVLAQGFPIDPDWYDGLASAWPENVDGICVVATEEYAGAYKHLVPFKDCTAILLRCPQTSQDHNCYHPGYKYRVSGMDTEFQPLSRDSHTIEEVSAAAWNYQFPASPIKKTLTLRDQDHKAIQTSWGAEMTDSQVREVLDVMGYTWQELSLTSAVLCSESDSSSDEGRCKAEVQYAENEKCLGLFFFGNYELQAECASINDAKEWCERQTAMVLLHTEG